MMATRKGPTSTSLCNKYLLTEGNNLISYPLIINKLSF